MVTYLIKNGGLNDIKIMEHVYIQRLGDKEAITSYKKAFEETTLEELVNNYNKQAKCGIVGVHQQGLYLIAMHFEFLKRLGESPVTFEENCIIGLVGKIELIKRQIRLSQ